MTQEITPEIIQKRIEILQWERCNRNLKNRNAHRVTGGCMYEPLGGEKKYGCAVGRLLPTEIQKQCDTTYLGQGSGVTNARILKMLPEDILALGKDFLEELQSLHDNSDNWTEEGVSRHGCDRFRRMEKMFCQL